MPTTNAGKAIASRNATTHGVFSKATVLPHLGEDPATFDALLQNLQNELRPYSLVQEHQVRQIAQSLWRLRRLEQWERSVIGNAELPDAEQNKQWERILRLDSCCAVRLTGPINWCERNRRRPAIPRGSGSRNALTQGIGFQQRQN